METVSQQPTADKHTEHMDAPTTSTQKIYN